MGPISLRRNIRVALLTCKIWKLGIFLVDYFIFERYTLYIRDGVCLLVLERETFYIWETLFLFGKDTLSFIFERETLYIWDKDSVFRFERETLYIWDKDSVFRFERETLYIWDKDSVFRFERETLDVWGRHVLFVRQSMSLYIWERDS